MNMMNPQMMQPQQAAQPAQAMPDQAQAAQVPEEVRGAQRVSNTEFQQSVQNLLLSRIQEEGEKNPNFGEAIDNGVSREAALELALILPELHPVFRAMGLFEGMEQGPIRAGGAQPQMQQVESDNPILVDGGVPVSRGLASY